MREAPPFSLTSVRKNLDRPRRVGCDGKAARDKTLGGKAQGQELTDKRAEIREIITSDLLQEIFLK
jgi:predicted MarR family transcription regulator